jgi:hypothetical protein
VPYAFELVIDAEESLAVGQMRVDSLREGHWLDPATRSLTTSLVLYNGQISYWATVRTITDVQRGGRLALSYHVGSFPADPYAPPPSVAAAATDGTGGTDGTAVPTSLLVFLDLVVLAYFVYLVLGSARRVWNRSRAHPACRRSGGGGSSSGGAGGGAGKRAALLGGPLSSAQDAWGEYQEFVGDGGTAQGGSPAASTCAATLDLVLSMLNWYVIMDWATIAAMISMFATWSDFCALTRSIRGEFAGADPALLAQQGASLFSSTAFSGTAARVMEAQLSWESVKVSATLALIFLTLRLFKYFEFQPRLAVMTEALSLACSDGFHFAFLLGILLSA